jgi:hypothetical protein
MKPKLGSGARFKKLEGSVEKEYEKKGKSEKKAKEIGAAIAAKVGREKYGEKKMSSWSKKGREDSLGRRK